tara:strand:- start:1123 stop:1446 length:324 start_codon:yes stop_codon:yes gene_type:complete
MKFEWKLDKDKELTFDDKIHNLACFEIVLNILRMKVISGEKNTNEEVQALCGFAMEAMFHDTDLSEEDMLDTIIKNKDKMVKDFKKSIQKECGIPDEINHGSEIGEA